MRYLRFLPLALIVVVTLISLRLVVDIRVRDQSHLYDQFAGPIEETATTVQVMVGPEAISQTIKTVDGMPHFVSLPAGGRYESSLGWNLAWQRADGGAIEIGFDVEMFTADDEERPVWRALSVEYGSVEVDEPQMIIDSQSQMIDVPGPGHYTIGMTYFADIDLPDTAEDQTVEGEIYRELIALPPITTPVSPRRSPFPVDVAVAALMDWQAWDMHPCERPRDTASGELDALCAQYDPTDPEIALEAAWLLLEAADDDMSSQSAQLMAQAGLMALLLEDFDAAVESFEASAIAYGHAQNTAATAAALHNLALAAWSLDINLPSDHYVRQAVHLRSTSPDETSAIFSACTLYVMWEEWDRAQEAAQRLLRMQHPAAPDLIRLIQSRR